jgi:hypothetical protein
MTRRTFEGTPVGLRFTLRLLLPVALAAATGCATAPRGVEKEAKPADIDSLKNIGAKANALLVFASSRAGGSHIFTMKSDGSETTQLTKGGLTEWNPRFSPDGSKILFSRSVEKGTREVDASADHAWNLFTMSPEGGEAALVAENATWGSWISNDEILFMRGRKIMRQKLSGEEAEAKKVMDLNKHSVFDGAIVRGPELSRDGHQIAMTLAGAHRQVGIWSLKKKGWRQIGSGGHITWFPDGASVVWVNPSGKGLAEIVRAPLEKPAPAAKEGEEQEEAEEGDKAEEAKDKGPAKLVDLAGKRSRESAPRLSPDGKWLVFAAAIGSAEPDLEDSELYLWELGSSESPTRLTFHSASDRSPDIFVGAPGAAPKAEETEKAAEPEKKEEPAEKACCAESAEPADKAEPEKKEEPAAADAAEPPTEDAEPAPSGKGKAKAKPAKKKKR